MSVKVLVVGPSQSGKSFLSNVLADVSDKPSEVYRKTEGCRILEFERELPTSKQNFAVELWDVGGDQKLSKCWPAIQRESSACVLVYNPEVPANCKEVEQWYDKFAASNGIPGNLCMLVGSSTSAKSTQAFAPPAKLSALTGGKNVHLLCPETAPQLRVDFDSFLEKVYSSQRAKQARIEEDLIA
uniref:Rab-like protein 5 n=1 Tax=Chromera velia CCMP2878 TaxID=1169474 RepID=A0A0G4FMQ8_9ALVE|eukprot:Cvel_17806.t1-p1 / transcript=Cvel_17806.t1 / gene=Cvel_17806 / organism=Chromera_velia_CCMP2878 / gene_product=Rab-like protein 5, putative / transcript_product=Rab-like protein 5, putative / location=Cvel_scaffold1442:19333-22450(+) / protein_length=184 / sequence_SO=supercontig / SO=protein_coding / is_pseudo=false